MFKKIVLSLLAILPLASFAAVDSPVTKGFYLGGFIGPAILHWEGFFNESGTDLVAVTPGIKGGYQFNRFFAVEVGALAIWQQFDVNNIEIEHPSVITDVALKGIIPITHRASIFAEIGPSIMVSTDGAVAVRPMLGVGASYYITNQWQVDLQYQGYFDFFGEIDVPSVGFTYHF